MSNHDQHLAELIDECVEAILLGAATIEECLERAPEHRAELEPLLRAALEMTTIPVMMPASNPARRAAFMAELRATPQDAPRFRMPSLPSFSFGSFSPLLRLASVATPAAVIAIVAVALVWSGGGTTTASAATLTVFAGQVEAQVDGNWQAIEDGASIQEGVTLRTVEASFAMLTFPDGSTATVGASTQLALDHIAVNGGRQISLTQTSGRIWNDVVSIRQGDSYVIRTPHAVVAAQGTVFETVVNGDTAVLTAEGLVNLAHGESSVDVAAGQIVRANAEGISAPQASLAAGRIEISGPVAAYVTSSRGAATGVLLNGLVFRQIPGIITSDVGTRDGVPLQTIAVGNADLGEYALVLRRYGPGSASVAVVTPASSLAIDVAESVAVARLPIEVAIATDGSVALRTLSSELESVGEVPQVRVVETDRSRAASGLSVPSATAGAEVVATRSATTVATQVLTTPTTTETVAPVATRDPATATPSPTATATATRTPAATATATRTPAATPLASATPDAWAGRLQAALATGSDRRVESVLEDLLRGDDATKAGRLATLAAAMSDPATAERIREQLDDDDRKEINREASRLVPALADSLRSALEEDDRGSRGSGPDPSRDNTGSDSPRNGGDNDDESDDDDSRGDPDRDRRFVPSWLEDWLNDLRDRRSGSRNIMPSTATATATATAAATPMAEPTPTAVAPEPTPEATRVPWWQRGR